MNFPAINKVLRTLGGTREVRQDKGITSRFQRWSTHLAAATRADESHGTQSYASTFQEVMGDLGIRYAEAGKRFDVVRFSHADAACLGVDDATRRGFLETGKTKEHYELGRAALKVCYGCSVRNGCLEFGLASNSYGVWGGTVAKERSNLRSLRDKGRHNEAAAYFRSIRRKYKEEFRPVPAQVGDRVVDVSDVRPPARRQGFITMMSLPFGEWFDAATARACFPTAKASTTIARLSQTVRRLQSEGTPEWEAAGDLFEVRKSKKGNTYRFRLPEEDATVGEDAA